MTSLPRTKKVFQPESAEELVKGWSMHAHKGRDRHDEAARRLDRYNRWLGGLAALFAAIAGTSLFTQLGGQGGSSLGGYLAGVIGFLAAVLASIQTTSNFAGRADSHRVAGVRYKAIIRKLEYVVSEHPPDGPPCNGWLESTLRDIEKDLDELEAKSPVVPVSIYRYIEKQYENANFVGKAEALIKRPVTA